MKITKINLLGLVLAMSVVAAGALFLLPDTSQAQVDCASVQAGATTDSDADGFTDAQECTGIRTVGTTPLAVSTCTAGVAGEQRNSCLDPNSKDVFVILVKDTSGSSVIDQYLSGQDPLEILKKTAANGGLGIAIHLLTAAQASSTRVVFGTQKAIRVTENLDVNGIATGGTTFGTPAGLDNSTVYTKRIANFVTQSCPNDTACYLYPSQTATPVNTMISTYIKNTIAHEASHSMKLAPLYDSRFNGYHNAAADVVMDQSVYHEPQGSGTTFHIPGVWLASDLRDMKLK